MTAIESGPDLKDLRRRLDGAVVTPRDEAWDASRQAFNLTFDQRPVFVALPAHERDVAAVIAYAQRSGLRVAPQRTGHNAEPLGDMSDLVLLKTDALQGVEIDAERRIARVRAGAKWENVVPAASDLGLAALHGSTPDVSVVGYSLGGGVGWYARKLGLSANSIAAIELVTADGQLRRVDHDNDAELFWALRGGGGNFGVVTAIEVELYPISEVYAGVLFFPLERAAEVLHSWHQWTKTAPDEVTSVGRILQFPPMPELPDALRGQSFAVVEAVYLGSEQEGAELMRPLRDLGPAMDTFAMLPPVGISELHMDPPTPTPYTGEGMMLGELSTRAIEEFVALTGEGSGSPLVSAEIRHLGGELSRRSPHHGALSTLDASYLTFGVGIVVDDESYAANRRQLDLLADALGPWDTGRQYLNFTEKPTDAGTFYRPDAYRRLQAVKAAVDPDGVFRANHPIETGR